MHGQSPGDAIGLARPERQQQVMELEQRGADGIHQAEPDDTGPRYINISYNIWIDTFDVPRAETQSAQSEKSSPDHEGQEGPPGCIREFDIDCVEDGSQVYDAFVDVATYQRLECGPSPEIQDFGGVRPLARSQVFPCSLGSAFGIPQRIPE